MFVLLLGVLVFTGCAERINEGWIAKQAAIYVAERENLDDSLRQNILAGKVTIGMFPDEAVAAGGPFQYRIADKGGGQVCLSVADIRYYFEYVQTKPVSPRIPPDILWMQRETPDTDLAITLTFWNRTQFDSKEFENFRVRFDESGRVDSIERMGTEEPQREQQVRQRYKRKS